MPWFAFEYHGDGTKTLHVFRGDGALSARNAWVSERRSANLLRPPGSRDYATPIQIEKHKGALIYHTLTPEGKSTMFTEV